MKQCKPKSPASARSASSRASAASAKPQKKSADSDGSKASKSTQTPKRSWPIGMDTPSGETSEHIEQDQEAATYWSEDFPVPELAMQELKAVLTTPTAVSGGSFTESSLNADPNLSALNSPKVSDIADSPTSSTPLPKSGIWGNGNVLEQATLEPVINESESSSFPTPTALDGGENRPAGDSKCEKWWRDNVIQEDGSQLSAEAMASIQGFPPDYLSSPFQSQPKPQTGSLPESLPEEQFAQPRQRSPLPESSISGGGASTEIDNQLISFEAGELVDIGEGEPATILEIQKNIAKVRSAGGAIKWRNLSEIALADSESATGEIDAVTPDGLYLPLLRTDGGTQMREKLNPETVEDYADDMDAGAIFPPVIIYYDGCDYWLTDGFHRIAAAKKLGRDRFQSDIRMGTCRDAVLFACTEANKTKDHKTAALRLNREAKRRQAETLLRDDNWSKWCDSEIARKCDLSQPTISAIRKQIGGAQQNRSYQKNGKIQTMNTTNIGNGGSNQKAVEDELKDKQKELGLGNWNGSQVLPDSTPNPVPNEVDDRPGAPVTPLFSNSSPVAVVEEKLSDEQYTPKYIWGLGLEFFNFERSAERAIKEYDLDPCSNSKNNPNVPAAIVYTRADNGLLMPWEANYLWLNPPYSNTGEWVEKLLQEYIEENVAEALVLVSSDNSTKWYQQLLEFPVCLINHRIKFENPGNVSAARFASSLFYLGGKVKEFTLTFDRRHNSKGLGIVCQSASLEVEAQEDAD